MASQADLERNYYATQAGISETDMTTMSMSQLYQAFLATSPRATYAPFVSLAALLDPLIVGTITRDANGAAISASVIWPDGSAGVYTGVASTSTPGAVDSYTVTKVTGGVTTTYTQPVVTRDASGAVTNRPAMSVA